MKYSLQLFDRLIGEVGIGKEDQDVYSVISKIKKAIFEMVTQDEIKVYVQNNQKSLLEQKQFENVGHKCDRVLFFLETVYYEFVNESLPISNKGRAKLFEKYSSLISNSKEEFKSILTEELFLVLIPILEVDTNPELEIRHANFIAQFWSYWSEERRLVKMAPTERDVVDFCISQNFNSPYFYKYIIKEIINELKEEEDPSISEMVLLNYIKRIRQLPVKI